MLPFVVAVDFTYAVSGIGGPGGRAYLLNLFGRNAMFRYQEDWVS